MNTVEWSRLGGVFMSLMIIVSEVGLALLVPDLTLVWEYILVIRVV